LELTNPFDGRHPDEPSMQDEPDGLDDLPHDDVWLLESKIASSIP